MTQPTTFCPVSIVHLDTGGGAGGDDRAAAGGSVEGLRLRAAEALERSYRFLESLPDEWALLRANVLCEALPKASLSERLAAVQSPDGSLPVGTLVSGGALGFPSIRATALSDGERALVGTLEGLLLAADAKVLHADWVEPAARFLESQQSDDGAFRVCGDLAAEAEVDVEAVFWTGMVAGILGRTPVSKPSHLERAGEFLGARFEPEVVERREGFPELLAYAHFFTNVSHDLADGALQWCGRALEKGFRSRELDAVATLRVLLSCDAQAMPGATFDAIELLERLLEEQAGDGGFAELSPGGAETRTAQTFDAMLGIVRLCSVF